MFQRGRSARRPTLDLIQRLLGIAKRRQVHVHFIHHGEEEAAHLAVGVCGIVEGTAALNAAAAAAEHDDGELIVVVIAGHHAGAIHEHRIVQQGAAALLN